LGEFPYVVAIGNRASCAAETCMGSTGGATWGELAVPQAATSATTASATTHMIGLGLPAAADLNLSNRK
jgi:hypothetical protein